MSRGSGRPSPVKDRAGLLQAKRIVVKIGSSSLSSVDGGLDVGAVERLEEALNAVLARGTQVVLVSSGAIAAGLAPLGLERRPRDLATQQAAAGVGQGLLVAHYSRAFARHGRTVAQVLLTADDLVRRTHYANAYRSLDKLLALGVVPIVNENDAVATHEIRFGDNDRLAALVANLVKADALVLLSDVDAVYTAPPSAGGTPLRTISSPADLEGVTLGSIGRAGVGTGGMVTKVQAATIGAQSGIPTLVTSATLAAEALRGEEVGTWFEARRGRRPLRLLWLEHLATTRGRLVLDDGAVAAVGSGKRSLLAAGIVAVEGEFASGDPVEIAGADGTVLARGLVNYDADELPEMLGQSTDALRERLGAHYERVVVHADDLALVGAKR
ncbi:glutamate 5-kinase [Galactobacter valiniphilus]|uniref:Glutamate 5-kinase n=1 Tax=Galactobacter valiniphilus TaxID=2676122 RepID=A0A399J6W6_9MICC|nr:glutamate 5-kinase [Galactobacter valiniphilus]